MNIKQTISRRPWILAVLVFGGFWGFWGVFFAIPLATLIKAILNAWPMLEVEAFSQPADCEGINAGNEEHE